MASIGKYTAVICSPRPIPALASSAAIIVRCSITSSRSAGGSPSITRFPPSYRAKGVGFIAAVLLGALAEARLDSFAFRSITFACTNRQRAVVEDHHVSTPVGDAASRL